MLMDDEGRPQPPSEIQSRLRAVDPLLSLRYLQGIGPVWAICMQWAESDPRWKTVQEGTTPPHLACDIIGNLPMDCGLDEAAAYIAKSIRTYPVDAVQSLVPRLEKYNESILSTQADKALGELLDRPDPSATKSRGYGRNRTKVPPTT